MNLNLSNLSKGIAVTAIFLVSSIILYVLYVNKVVPDLFFVVIAMGVIILVCVYVMIRPSKERWRTVQVFPVKRKK